MSEGGLDAIRPPDQKPPEQADERAKEEAAEFATAPQKAMTAAMAAQASHAQHVADLKARIDHHCAELDVLKGELASHSEAIREANAEVVRLAARRARLEERLSSLGWPNVTAGGLMAVGGGAISLAGVTDVLPRNGAPGVLWVGVGLLIAGFVFLAVVTSRANREFPPE